MGSVNNENHLQAAETAVILWGKAEYIRMVLANSGITDAKLGPLWVRPVQSHQGEGESLVHSSTVFPLKGLTQ